MERPEIGEDDLADLARRYEARQERDRTKLDRMVAYAQSALCRWRHLLEAFGEVADDECGHCDNCRRAVHRQVLQAAPPVERAALATIEAPAIQVGDAITVPVHGAGEVQSVDDDHVEVLFPDGTLRKFKPDFLVARAS